MTRNIEEITQEVKKANEPINLILDEISKVIIGQKYLIQGLTLGLISGEHILVEGLPGLAKTTAVKALSETIHGKFKRIQFTPDLLPADILGTQVYQPKTGEFAIKKGPLFSNIVLADEINRAPAKVQSALLESMQERQITIADQTYPLEQPFLVMATQNPIEQEGTYPLPEAQLDRFMFKLKIGYPTREEEKLIVKQSASPSSIKAIVAIASQEDILNARKSAELIYIDENLEDYIVDVVSATRSPEKFKLPNLRKLIQYGASPRASIFLSRASKAYAFLNGRGYVMPQDIKTIGFDVLRHRILLTYEAEAENISTDQVIQQIFDAIEVP
jgi:MoxR-like ATPase|tara:strand:- start:72 stop:1064 length:993 start_codon:yes stop_codon:yes gene_type:complete